MRPIEQPTISRPNGRPSIGPGPHSGMGRLSAFCSLILAMAVCFPGTALAQSECTLPVAAYLTDADGAPIDGALEVELRFYVDGAPDALPVECRSAEPIAEHGWIRLLVDACGPPPPGACGVSALNEVFAASDEVWVEIRVGDEPVDLAPRFVVGAVPYALRATTSADAELLDGRSADEFALADDLAAHLAEPHGSGFGVPTQISVGRSGCALIDQRPICWPLTDIFPAGRRYTQIELGSRSACAIDADDNLECFYSEWDAIGTVIDAVPAGSYVAVAPHHEDVCAITTAGALRCWGESSLLPAEPDGEFDEVAVGGGAIFGGGEVACAIDRAGAIHCWGEAHSDMIAGAPADSPYRSLALGTNFGCAIRSDTDALVCWGTNTPTVPAGTYDTVVAAGTGVCLLTSAGTVGCWDNRHDDLANWPYARIPEGPGYSQIAIGLDALSTDWEAACALHDSGEVHCWSMFNGNTGTVTQVPLQLRYR